MSNDDMNCMVLCFDVDSRTVSYDGSVFSLDDDVESYALNRSSFFKSVKDRNVCVEVVVVDNTFGRIDVLGCIHRGADGRASIHELSTHVLDFTSLNGFYGELFISFDDFTCVFVPHGKHISWWTFYPGRVSSP